MVLIVRSVQVIDLLRLVVLRRSLADVRLDPCAAFDGFLQLSELLGESDRVRADVARLIVDDDECVDSCTFLGALESMDVDDREFLVKEVLECDVLVLLHTVERVRGEELRDVYRFGLCDVSCAFVFILCHFCHFLMGAILGIFAPISKVIVVLIYFSFYSSKYSMQNVYFPPLEGLVNVVALSTLAS